MNKMKIMSEDGLIPSEKRCTTCGGKGYYLENGSCLECIEAEMRRSIIPAFNGNGGLSNG
jgi:hypothetical protein